MYYKNSYVLIKTFTCTVPDLLWCAVYACAYSCIHAVKYSRVRLTDPLSPFHADHSLPPKTKFVTKSPITCGIIKTIIATQMRQQPRHKSFLPSCTNIEGSGSHVGPVVAKTVWQSRDDLRTPGPKISLMIANGPIITAAVIFTRVSGSGRCGFAFGSSLPMPALHTSDGVISSWRQ